MSLSDWLKYANNQLKKSNIDSHYLDSLIIAETVFKFERGYLLAHGDINISSELQKQLDSLLSRRIQHEPIAYITNQTYFYNHEFYVDKKVMIPKPESEDFINLFQKLDFKPGDRLLDIGTGSGCLAITAKLLAPQLVVYAADNDKHALEVAKINSNKHKTSINFVQSNLAPKDLNKLSIIFANLPYVPLNFSTSSETQFEPNNAIYAKNDGFALYEKLAPLAQKALSPKGYFLVEAMEFQHRKLIKIIESSGFNYEVKAGLVILFVKK